jgi:acyl-coenzyme A thioesterase PaaI-like protein
MSESIFVAEADHFVPTDRARGPWTPEAQHGGAPAALLARAIERFEGGPAMFVSRLTVELLRPVPIAPLTVRTRALRPGKKVQLVEASLLTGETEVARCTGLRMRRADLPVPDRIAVTAPPKGPAAGAEKSPGWETMVNYTAFHRDGVEHRFVAGGFSEPGPASDWIRLRVPLIAGEETSPLCRVAAAADFGNGISAVLERGDGYSFVNPDLTIYLHRYPAGEWVCLEARTEVSGQGIGMAESRLYDEHGAIGRSVQSLFIDRMVARGA